MLRTRDVLAAAPRRGVILIVVLALLTLFAIVALSFVSYAGAAASSSRMFLEAETPAAADVDPELLFAYFMGQLVYDVPDNPRGFYSCLRGHSLARNMYGLNYTKTAAGAIQYVDAAGVPLNQVPFNGSGRLHTKFPNNNPFKHDDFNLINYTYFKQDAFR